MTASFRCAPPALPTVWSVGRVERMVSQSRACSFINRLRTPFAGLSLSRSKQHRQRLTAKDACPPPAHPPTLWPVTATSGHITPAARGRTGWVRSAQGSLGLLGEFRATGLEKRLPPHRDQAPRHYLRLTSRRQGPGRRCQTVMTEYGHVSRSWASPEPKSSESTDLGVLRAAGKQGFTIAPGGLL